MKPRVLLAHSLLWPNVARLAIAFRNAGFAVDAIAPAGHPVHRMRSPERTFTYRLMAPRASLQQAIEASQPRLIVPCDDRVVGHLRELHARSAGGGDRDASFSIPALIEDSLGPPSSFTLLAHRRLLGSLSDLPDVHIPRTDPIEDLRQFQAWADEHGLPAVLKLDGGWGGRDVVLVSEPASIPTAFRRILSRRGALHGLRDSLLNRDFEKFFRLGVAPKRGVSVQAFVKGRLANCAIACWRGEVLASIAVEVVKARSAFGMATVVRVVEGRGMIAAATSIARHLQLSGLCGFDFVLDDDSGQAKLIEINPRATQIHHLSRHAGADLPTALRRALLGEPAEAEIPAEPIREIALFPQEWLRDRNSPYLSSAFHDVPHEEPELTKYYGYETADRGPQRGSDSALDLGGNIAAPEPVGQTISPRKTQAD